MKRNHRIAAVLALCLAGIALAAPMLSLEQVIKVFRPGIYVGAAGISNDTDNLIKESLGECASVNYVGTDGGASAFSCDCVSVAKTGVAVGDPCFTSAPKNVDGGTTDISSDDYLYRCEVQVPNVIKSCLCAWGVTGDPDAGTQCFRTLSSQ